MYLDFLPAMFGAINEETRVAVTKEPLDSAYADNEANLNSPIQIWLLAHWKLGSTFRGI